MVLHLEILERGERERNGALNKIKTYSLNFFYGSFRSESVKDVVAGHGFFLSMNDTRLNCYGKCTQM